MVKMKRVSIGNRQSAAVLRSTLAASIMVAVVAAFVLTYVVTSSVVFSILYLMVGMIIRGQYISRRKLMSARLSELSTLIQPVGDADAETVGFVNELYGADQVSSWWLNCLELRVVADVTQDTTTTTVFRLQWKYDFAWKWRTFDTFDVDDQNVDDPTIQPEKSVARHVDSMVSYINDILVKRRKPQTTSSVVYHRRITPVDED